MPPGGADIAPTPEMELLSPGRRAQSGDSPFRLAQVDQDRLGSLGGADIVHRLGLFPRWRAASDGLNHGADVKLRYFAWVRERIGKTEEDIDPPDGVATVGDLISWLAGRGEEYAHAFENPKVIRTAIDRAHVKADATIGSAREVAFFPPMTGG